MIEQVYNSQSKPHIHNWQYHKAHTVGNVIDIYNWSAVAAVDCYAVNEDYNSYLYNDCGGYLQCPE